MFSMGIFLQFVSSVFSLCFTAFQMAIVVQDGAQFIRLAVYFATLVTEISLYCFYGNDIIVKSMEIGQSLYMSNWYKADPKVKNTLFIIMEMSKKHVTLKAGNFFTLSLVMLTTVLRSSYSYFAVLQRIYN